MVGRCKHLFPITLIAAVAIVTVRDAVHQPLQAGPTIVCNYDPSTGAPNPLGMRAFITLTETEDATEAVYEQLGAFVPGPAEAILTTERSLVFPGKSIDQVRQLLLSTPNYYRELVGFNDSDGFAPVNNTLICRAEAVVSAPRPAASAELPDLGSAAPRAALPDLEATASNRIANTPGAATFYGTIAGLADGNYRYVSGPADNRIYSEQELLRRGGVLFVFRKTGDELVGAYSYIDGESVCMAGRVTGNTVTGQAYPDSGVTQDLAEEFAFWGPATFLRVRRSRGNEGARYYGSAVLELGDFSKINAGSSLPPSTCELS
ncbi:MAG: hypothetical protein F6K31_43160 [Symploca sp. SIO2G7]|nr:hypothetical protein [Symploca sp. SIO2G7]